MDKFSLPLPLPLPQKLADSGKRKTPIEDDSRRSSPSKKMRLDKETEYANGSTNKNNDSSNSTSSSLEQRQGSHRASRSPRTGIDPLTSNAHKSPLPKLLPPRSKVVNWRLACFMAREYLSRGTLLGKQWPPQDSNTATRENATAKPKLTEGEESGREKEKEWLYTVLSTDFLRSDDVYIPGVLNPSQLAAWLGFK